MVTSATKTLVLDNGAYNIKAGYAGHAESLRCVRNCSIRGKVGGVLYADQVDPTGDLSGVTPRLPFERGYVVNWQLQRDIWNRLFSPDVLNCTPDETTLLLTQPCFNMPVIAQSCDEVVFEEFGFASYHRATAPVLAQYCLSTQKPPECVVIVDAGYSFTHIVPICNGRPVWKAVRRIDVGGKLITNHLKEIISFRQWNMMDETFLINNVKESCCYISTKFEEDQEACSTPNNDIVQDYVLPDIGLGIKGHVRQRNDGSQPRPDEQVLVMNNERFTVTETLFNPSDIGLEQAGIPEAILHAVGACDTDLQGLFYNNIIVIGGNARIPGFKSRLDLELRALIPVEYDLSVVIPERPDVASWQGGVHWAEQFPEEFGQKCVTKAEYAEHGLNICNNRFR
ncbi:Actin- protein 6 [Geranomyces variabilis]|nr:Actin- protein 6 [Geranomyces variabilis]